MINPRIRNILSIVHILLPALILGFLSEGCSHTDPPQNIEPTLIICEATEVSRSSSVITVKIENPGSSKLSYIRFRYGIEGDLSFTTPDLNAEESSVSYELTDLKPGTTYTYCAEGGTSTATVRSAQSTFSTIPNERPKVSKPEILSSGPTGAIVEFEIEDDGGESILDAGCIVTDNQSQNGRRIPLSKDKLKEGKQQIYITGLTLQSTYTITPYAANSSGETLGEIIEYTTRNGIILHEAGTLEFLFGDNPLTIKALTIAGDMNGSDFRFLRMLAGAPVAEGGTRIDSSVEEIYLSDVSIIEGGESFDGSRFTEKNIVSTGMFAGCGRLKCVILPNSTTAIRRDAFSNSPLLETFNIPIEVSELSNSTNCGSLRSIQVSEANRYFRDIDGVVFNKEATEILWFPLGKTGNFTLPSTITAIGENAFAGTNITSIVIPSSVTTIHRGAFFGSKLKDITLPDNLKNISEGMFQNCATLETVHLGKATEFIGNYAFDGTHLISLYIDAQLPPYVSTDAFKNNAFPLFDNCTLYVPQGCKALYRNHSKWKQFQNIVEINSGNN